MEGVGTNLLAIVAPSILASHFKGRTRALALGIWTSWYPLGSTAMFLIAPPLASVWGWRSAWWSGCVYAVAAGILFLLMSRKMTGSSQDNTREGVTGTEKIGVLKSFRNREVWIMVFMYFSFAFMYIAYLTWTPTFLHRYKGLSLSYAAFIMSFFSVAGIVSPTLSGWILSRVQCRKAICITALTVFSLLALLTRFLTIQYLLFFVVILGLIGGIVPLASIAAIARLIQEKKVGPVALSVLTVGQNAGILLGPTLFGSAMESSWGWTLAYALFIPAGLLGISVCLFLPEQHHEEDAVGQ
jgi:predicted MFS family arabinose efflux permease